MKKFWKGFGKVLVKAAPVAVALTPMPFDDIALGLVNQFRGMSAEEKSGALRIMIGEIAREVNPALSDSALALVVEEIMQVIRRKAAGDVA